jgi:hypothetical protein
MVLSCSEQCGEHTGHRKLPAERGGAVHPADCHGGAAARALGRPHPDPREQRHQPQQHRDCQGEHATGHRIHLPGQFSYRYMHYLYRIRSPVSVCSECDVDIDKIRYSPHQIRFFLAVLCVSS